MGAKAATCPLCGSGLEGIGAVIPRSESCPGCGADLHACHACRFHDPVAHNQCREPKAEWQARRDRGNYCDFFELAAGGPQNAPDPREAERKKQLDDLFRNF
ncbi:MAG: hypothetical protein OEY97_03425 [Nitrospirota bacterium]|nr:hypothetical protein [Nitrospirota bacterium]